MTATGSYIDLTTGLPVSNTKDITALVLWSSSLPSVASISNASGSQGFVTSETTGTTTIKTTSGNISASVTLTVTPANPVSIAIAPANPTIVLGANEQFTATGNYSDGSTQNLTASVVWSSSSTNVATISNASGSNGKATSQAAGAATITATLGSVSGSTTLTITSPTGTAPSSYTTPVVGVLPSSVALDASGNVWVTNFGINNMTELSTGLTASGGAVSSSSLNSFTTFPQGASAGSGVFGISLDYLGDIWTTNYNAFNGGYKISMLELNSPGFDNTGCATVPIGTCTCPSAFALTGLSTGPSGNVYYRFAAGNNPLGMAIDASSNVWVANNGTPSNPGNTITKFVPAYYFYSSLSPCYVNISSFTYNVGNNPYGIAIDASGNVWISNYGSNTVTELNSSGALLNTYTVGNGPRGIAIDPSGNVWVANSGSDTSPGNTVTMITPSTGTTTNYTVGTGPHSIAIETSGNVWVTNFGTTTSPGNTITELVFNGSNILSKTIPFTVGKNPEGISIDFWGNVWVTNYYDNTLTVWKGATTGPHFSPYAGPIWPQ